MIFIKIDFECIITKMDMVKHINKKDKINNI